MKRKVFNTLRTLLLVRCALIAAMAGLVGCADEFPYQNKPIRTDCRGNEIVGIWETSKNPKIVKGSSNFHSGPDGEPHSTAMSEIIVFHSDGTGRSRFNGGMTTAVSDNMLQWKYEGSGVWSTVSVGWMRAKQGEVAPPAHSPGTGVHWYFALTGDLLVEQVYLPAFSSGKAGIAPIVFERSKE
jgi:hypothetical protein